MGYQQSFHPHPLRASYAASDQCQESRTGCSVMLGEESESGKAMALNRNTCSRPFGLAPWDKCIKFGKTKVP